MTDQSLPKIRYLMMIDDNPIDQMLHKRIIDRSGFAENIQSFSLATTALEHLKASPDNLPELILLDVNMPKMDGFEFLEAVEACFETEFCAVVVMLTTSLDPRDVERAARFGMVKKYLDKPLTEDKVRELAALVTDN